MYLYFEDEYGTINNLSDVVKFGSMSGFDGHTGTVNTTNNADYTGTLMTRISWESREITLTIPVWSNDYSAMEYKESQYLKMFRQTTKVCKLRYIREDGTGRIAEVYVSRGYPSRQKLSNFATLITVGFTAAKPYWYSNSYDSVSSGSSYTNNGDYPAMVILTPSADTVTYGGGTIKARTGQSIIGATITIDENGVTAVDSSGDNILHKIDLSSEFGMLPVGTATVTGAKMLVVKRWGSA